MPADGSSVLHMCKRPTRCCYTCGYHAQGCRHRLRDRIWDHYLVSRTPIC